LGIPHQFAPHLTFGWAGKGENMIAERRAELRRVAQTRIQAIEARAVVEIAHEALRASTEIVAFGLTSQVARNFLNELAPLERLMPALEFKSVEETLIGKPIKDRYGSNTNAVHERLTVATPELEVKETQVGQPAMFVCHRCSEQFASAMWHCPGCDRHWPRDIEQCSNCYVPRKILQLRPKPG
jgi:lipopolysaccharide biosynthesis regulator YciM